MIHYKVSKENQDTNALFQIGLLEKYCNLLEQKFTYSTFHFFVKVFLYKLFRLEKTNRNVSHRLRLRMKGIPAFEKHKHIFGGHRPSQNFIRFHVAHKAKISNKQMQGKKCKLLLPSSNGKVSCTCTFVPIDPFFSFWKSPHQIKKIPFRHSIALMYHKYSFFFFNSVYSAIIECCPLACVLWRK